MLHWQAYLTAFKIQSLTRVRAAGVGVRAVGQAREASLSLSLMTKERNFRKVVFKGKNYFHFDADQSGGHQPCQPMSAHASHASPWHPVLKNISTRILKLLGSSSSSTLDLFPQCSWLSLYFKFGPGSMARTTKVSAKES